MNLPLRNLSSRLPRGTKKGAKSRAYLYFLRAFGGTGTPACALTIYPFPQRLPTAGATRVTVEGSLLRRSPLVAQALLPVLLRPILSQKHYVLPVRAVSFGVKLTQ
jgi:hypothetical protein